MSSSSRDGRLDHELQGVLLEAVLVAPLHAQGVDGPGELRPVGREGDHQLRPVLDEVGRHGRQVGRMERREQELPRRQPRPEDGRGRGEGEVEQEQEVAARGRRAPRSSSSGAGPIAVCCTLRSTTSKPVIFCRLPTS